MYLAGPLVAMTLVPAVALAGFISSASLTPGGSIVIDEGSTVSFNAAFSAQPQNMWNAYTPRFLFGNGQYYNVVGYGTPSGRIGPMTFYDAVSEGAAGNGSIVFNDGAGGHSGAASVGALGGTTAFSWAYADEGAFSVNAVFQSVFGRQTYGTTCDYAWANYFSGDAWCTAYRNYSNSPTIYAVSANRSTTVTVRNVAPTIASLVVPTTIESMQSFAFSATATDPGVNDILQYSWDLDGDGTFGDAIGNTGTTLYATAGSRSIGLRVTDGDGGIATMRRDILIVDRVADVPEPGSLALLAIGLVGLAGGATSMRRLRG